MTVSLFACATASSGVDLFGVLIDRVTKLSLNRLVRLYRRFDSLSNGRNKEEAALVVRMTTESMDEINVHEYEVDEKYEKS